MTVIAFHWWDIIPVLVLAVLIGATVLVWRVTHR